MGHPLPPQEKFLVRSSESFVRLAGYHKLEIAGIPSSSGWFTSSICQFHKKENRYEIQCQGRVALVRRARFYCGLRPVRDHSNQHVIMVFQENRTPDNLFQGLCTANGGVPGCTATGAGGTYEIESTYVN